MVNHQKLDIEHKDHMVMVGMDLFVFQRVLVQLWWKKELMVNNKSWVWWLLSIDWKKLLTYWRASYKWIPSIFWWTTTNWIMINNFASSTNSACTRAGITTFLIATCLIRGTFRTNNAFWSTSWWTTNIARYTRTYSLAINFATLTVWSTWTWITRVFNFGC